MFKLSRQTILLMILLTGAGISWWVMSLTEPDLDAFTASKEGPDYFMDNFITAKLSNTGKPLHRLNAERLTHYPQQKYSDVVKPLVTFYDEDSSVWTATANLGKVLGDGKEVQLIDDVNIVSPGTPATKITINTRDLHIVPDKNFAETKNTVVLQQNQNTVTATGMQAYFAVGNIEFKSDVRGWYVQ
ncbi:MAG: LPS export ABC transporter periplasmic protein LptC [Gammaproteobacteria bacterium]|nr:LPS export ABC transporter periplasmic protein LptC [Gammaproteobacteria bacterium]